MPGRFGRQPSQYFGGVDRSLIPSRIFSPWAEQWCFTSQRALQTLSVQHEAAEALLAEADKCVPVLRASEAHWMALASSYRAEAEQLRAERDALRAEQAAALEASLRRAS